MSNNKHFNRAIRATVLQKVANYEIYHYGQASTGVVKRLLDLVDSFTSEEGIIFIELCEKMLPPDRNEGYEQEHIDILLGK